jgi:hypothetical protein
MKEPQAGNRETSARTVKRALCSWEGKARNAKQEWRSAPLVGKSERISAGHVRVPGLPALAMLPTIFPEALVRDVAQSADVRFDPHLGYGYGGTS